MRIGIYVRVSTDEQAKEGASIPAQLRILNAQAVLKGADDVVEYVDDGYSAKNLNRPAVQRLIADCNARKLDMVLVWKSDRLTRNLRDLLMLVEDVFEGNSVEFASAMEPIDTSNPAGRLMLNVLGAFAQSERETTSLRTKTVMLEQAKLGKHLGGRPPYGYAVTPDMFYEIVPREAEAVRMAFEIKASGGSYSEIIAALDAAGHKTRSGTSFERNTLYDMLRNEKYTGTYIYNRAAAAGKDGRRNNRASKPESEIERIPGGMPAIIPIELWEAVRSMSQEGKALGGKNSAKNIYLLSGIVRCGGCGKNMAIANGGKNRDGSYWRVYRCKDKCVKGVEYQKLEACVLNYLISAASDGDIVQRTLDLADQFNTYATEDSQETIAPMRAALAEMQRERDNLLKLAAKSDDPPASLLQEIQRRDQEISLQKEKISKAELAASLIDKNEIMDHFRRLIGIRELDKAEQKTVVKEIVDSVTIYDDRIDISITTRTAGGPDPIRAVMVKLLTLTVSKSFIHAHKLPQRFL